MKALKALKTLKSITRIIALAPVLALMFSLMTGFAVRASETGVGGMSGTKLHFAVLEGDISTVLRLIDEGYNIHEKTDLIGTPLLQGNTPLHLAALVAVPEIAKALIEKGADVNVKNKEGWTPLTLAINGPIFDSIHVSRSDGRFYEETARVLIADGADVNVKVLESGDKEGLTPLHYFISDMEMVQSLIARGADVNARSATYPPLIMAAKDGYTEIVRVLIANGADVNVRDNVVDRTPLHWAKNAEIAQALISAGADVNAWSGFDGTPMMMEIKEDSIKRVLRAAGGKCRGVVRVTDNYEPVYGFVEC